MNVASAYRNDNSTGKRPSSCQQHGVGVPTMSFTTDEIPFCPREHRKRVMDALRRRLYPKTAMHEKQLAGLIGVTSRTVRNWVDGSTGLSSEHFGRLFATFGVGFYAEVYGEIGMAMQRRFAQRKRAELQRLQSEENILNLLAGNDA